MQRKTILSVDEKQVFNDLVIFEVAFSKQSIFLGHLVRNVAWHGDSPPLLCFLECFIQKISAITHRFTERKEEFFFFLIKHTEPSQHVYFIICFK